jgi:hypothetical protein
MADETTRRTSAVSGPLDPATPEEQVWPDEMAADFRAAFAQTRQDEAERLARGELEPPGDHLPEGPPDDAETIGFLRLRKDDTDTPRD